MAMYIYRPVWGGALWDPEPEGGEVSRIDLHSEPERNGTVVATAGPAVRIGENAYRFTLPDNLPDGRYWCVVTFTPEQGASPAADRTSRMDLPLGTGLIASAEQLADDLGVPLPLTPAQREDFRDKIGKAQSEVAAYLKRPLVPTPKTLRDVSPMPFYELTDPRAWPMPPVDDVMKVVSYEQNAEGLYTVRLLIGLDAAVEKPIVDYVTAHAAERIRNGPGGEKNGGRRVTSVSAEGQSISYETSPVAGQAGALPTLDSLGDYRKRLYRPIAVAPATPWPYGGRPYRRYGNW